MDVEGHMGSEVESTNWLVGIVLMVVLVVVGVKVKSEPPAEPVLIGQILPQVKGQARECKVIQKLI
jgi:hypothetical protein